MKGLYTTNATSVHCYESFINNQHFGLYKPVNWFYMLTQKQLKIFDVFAKKPFAEFTRKQVKRESKENSNNTLASAINRFKKEEIVIEKKVGKSGLLTLNLDSDLTLHHLALANNQRTDKTVKTAIKRLKDEISGVTKFYSLVIFGSHAINKQKETSDLDIAVMIEEKDKIKHVESAINSAKLKILVNIDAHVIPKKEFIEMLTNNEENLGKQIARKHLVVHNHAIFYELVKEGMRHGFNA